VSRSRIPELEVIEFKGAKAIADYSRMLRALGRDLAAECEASAEEVKAVLSRQAGHPLLFGVDVRVRARKVARRLKRAAELGQGVAIEAVKFNQEFRLQFADVIEPKRRRRPEFDFNDDN
jgi:hypothetical protein